MYCPETKEVVRVRKRDLCDMWCAYTNTCLYALIVVCACLMSHTHIVVRYTNTFIQMLYSSSLVLSFVLSSSATSFCSTSLRLASLSQYIFPQISKAFPRTLLLLLLLLVPLPLLLVRQYLCRWCSKHMLSLKMTRFAIPTVHFISLSLFRSRARALRLVHGSLSLDLSAHSSAAAFVLKGLVKKN